MVDLPDPFAPMRPRVAPGGTSKETSESAQNACRSGPSARRRDGSRSPARSASVRTRSR